MILLKLQNLVLFCTNLAYKNNRSYDQMKLTECSAFRNILDNSPERIIQEFLEAAPGKSDLQEFLK